MLLLFGTQKRENERAGIFFADRELAELTAYNYPGAVAYIEMDLGRVLASCEIYKLIDIHNLSFLKI